MAKELDGLMKKLMAKSKKEWDEKEKKRQEEKAKEVRSVDGKLTDQQIENWRKVLCLQIGPYALIMPREEIQKIRDKMQGDVYNWGDREKGEKE